METYIKSKILDEVLVVIESANYWGLEDGRIILASFRVIPHMDKG